MAQMDKPEVVVVTGASAGVGRATAVEFARHGARVALIARGAEGLEGANADVQAAGGQALVIQADVSDAAAMEAAAARVEEELGPIDVWVNNAMTSVFAPFTRITPEEYKRVTEVTYLGYVYGTRAALERMLPRDRGVIVQVGSALAYRAIPLQSAYCGAKHAIQGFTESIRSELIHEGSDVHITMVQMPALNTPQFGWVRSRLPNKPQPVPPIYQPEVAARAVYWAAHNRRREVSVGTPSAIIILANKFVPGFGDWYLGKTGYDSQQTDEPADPDRPDNLYDPVPGDRGAHGDFDEQAKSSSPQFWLNTHRVILAAGVATGLAASLAAVLGFSRSRR